MRKISLEGLFCPKNLADKRFLYALKATFFLFLFAISSVYSYAQSGSTVKGTVQDTQGMKIIGVNILIKGTGNGAITDLDGNFTLTDVKQNNVIQVSYIGYISQEITYTGQALHVVLIEESQKLDEIVVTALGIKRDKKSLGYALSEVKGDALSETRDANVANALAGKVAGLQIKQASTGPSGSSRIVLRGNNSIGGNNQPLVVVDGVPIDSSTGGSDDYWGNRAVDRGSGMSDISPDDIQTISVLKGPAAAALYGSRAGNGVIMITTKTGKGKTGIGVSYNTNLTFDSPMQLPKYQNIYGQGSEGSYVANTSGSWGEKMTGQNYVDHVGNSFSYSPANNDLTDFLKTGTTWTNSVELTSSSEKNSVRMAAMNLSNNGVIPNSSFDRTSVTLRGTAELTAKLSLDAKLTYINQKTKNRIKLGGDPDNIFNNYLMMPRSVSLSNLNRPDLDYAYKEGTISTSTGTDVSGKPISWTDAYGGNIRNPYWAAYKNTNSDRKNRFIGFTSLKYEFTDWLNIQGRYGMDYTSATYKDRLAAGTPYWFGEGDFIMSKDESYGINTDFLITFNKNLTEKLGLLATGGGSVMYQRAEGMWGQTKGLIVPDFFNLSNGKNKDMLNSLTRKQINSLYATASLSWDNMIYLDMTARNDWSSTLNPDNRSYFYPSIGASWLFTETFKEMGPINFGKLRASWAQVGNDTEPYQLYNYRTITTSGSGEGAVLVASKSDILAQYNLKNETINSYEIGLELRAFKNRVGLDIAYYNKEAKDQILKMDVSSTTGWAQKYINAGNVRNRGVEVMLTGTVIQSKDFTWDVAVNYAKNSNKILELADGAEEQVLSHSSYSSMVRIVAKTGGSFGDIYGKGYKRDENGQIVVGSNGAPVFESDYKKLGNSNPDWMGGIINTFRYKGFDLSFQIDMRYGGEVFMGSIRNGVNNGNLAMTLEGREGGFVIPGVLNDGSANSINISAQNYWSALTGGAEPWVYDATNVRLREVNFGYTLPRLLLRKTPLQAVKLSLVGRNLWMIHSKTKGFDPEAGFSTGNAQGFEYGSMPTLRSLGFNLNVTF